MTRILLKTSSEMKTWINIDFMRIWATFFQENRALCQTNVGYWKTPNLWIFINNCDETHTDLVLTWLIIWYLNFFHSNYRMWNWRRLTLLAYCQLISNWLNVNIHCRNSRATTKNTTYYTVCTFQSSIAFSWYFVDLLSQFE